MSIKRVFYGKHLSCFPLYLCEANKGKNKHGRGWKKKGTHSVAGDNMEL